MHKNNIIHNLEHVISRNETVLNREKKKKKKKIEMFCEFQMNN